MVLWHEPPQKSTLTFFSIVVSAMTVNEETIAAQRKPMQELQEETCRRVHIPCNQCIKGVNGWLSAGCRCHCGQILHSRLLFVVTAAIKVFWEGEQSYETEKQRYNYIFKHYKGKCDVSVAKKKTAFKAISSFRAWFWSQGCWLNPSLWP